MQSLKMGLPQATLALLVLALSGVASNHAYGQALGNAAGVYIDADQTLRVRYVNDPQGLLTRERAAAAKAQLDPQVMAPSNLRKVSLTRLEKAIEKAIEEGREPTDDMLHLAGLQRLQYIFYYPETQDIVIAGPAEGWMRDAADNVRGLTSGRPTLKLEDLVVALRAFPPSKKSNTVIGCSIDPTEAGLQKMNAFLNKVGRSITPNDTQFLVKGLKENLGLQTVTVMGVPATTHFAQVLVEADYRMKLIGIGLEQPAHPFASYVDLVNPAAVARNAMQRWYFTPNYECVRVTEDKHAMELVGLGVKLVGEDELVAENGGRVQAGTSNAASQQFVTGFTKNYEALAAKTPVYAQLRNLIDLSIAAAYLQQQNLYSQAGWDLVVFGNEKLFEVEKYNTPKHVESAVNSLWKNRTLMTPVGGGVTIYPRKALAEDKLLQDTEGTLKKTQDQVQLNVPADRWWWD